MDLLTQGLLGAALSQTIAQKKEMRLATIVGFAAGILADSDALITSNTDPLLYVEYHRHFTHSLLFIPFGALIAALILWPFLYRQLDSWSSSRSAGFKRLYLFCLAGYSLSGFIDACTSYGTHLLWPFSDERLAFNIISIIDPVFTGALLIAVITSIWKYRPYITRLALLFCAMYLLIGYTQHERAVSLAEQLAGTRGHNINKLVVKPTLGNLVLWRSTYISGDYIYVDAVRVGIQDKIYPGESVALFIPQRDAHDIPADSVLYKDILRFAFFPDDFLALDKQQPELLGDIRYSMLPNSTSSLWGISLDRDQPQQHAAYGSYRDTSAQTRAAFFSMLKGE